MPDISAYEPGGVTRFTPEQEAILRQPVNPDLVEIRYDGAVYMPGAWYRKVLNDAFGPGGWRIVPLGRPLKDGNEYTMNAALVGEGRVIAETWAEYKASQQFSVPTKGTIFESLCTDAISKCCKTLGVAEELWFPSWTRNWLEGYAEQYQNDKGKWVWRRKDDFAGHDKIKPGYSHMDVFNRPSRVEDENNAHMEAIKGEGKLRAEPLGTVSDNERDALRQATDQDWDDFGHTLNARKFDDGGREK